MTLSPASSEQVTVDYATSDGTATAGTDYTATSGTLTFAANETSQTISVSVAGDTDVESYETFTMTLSNPDPADITLLRGTATGYIIDNVAGSETGSGVTLSVSNIREYSATVGFDNYPYDTAWWINVRPTGNPNAATCLQYNSPAPEDNPDTPEDESAVREGSLGLRGLARGTRYTVSVNAGADCATAEMAFATFRTLDSRLPTARARVVDENGMVTDQEDVTIEEGGGTVTLDGSLSSHPSYDASDLTYTWSSTGSLSLTLSETSGLRTSFEAPSNLAQDRTGTVTLTVETPAGRTDSDISVIQVLNIPSLGLGTDMTRNSVRATLTSEYAKASWWYRLDMQACTEVASSKHVDITGLDPSTDYDLRVYSNSACTNEIAGTSFRTRASNDSTSLPALVPAAPAAPTFGAATQTSLVVNWVAPANTGPDISDYDLRYRVGNSGSFTNAGYDGTATSHTITGLTAGTSYQVQVRAKNENGNGSWSAPGTAATSGAPVPAAPAAPTFGAATQTSLVVNWVAPTNDGPDISDYDLRYRVGNSGSFTNAGYDGTATGHTITGLTADTSYQVQVRAKNGNGNGPWSAPGTAATSAAPLTQNNCDAGEFWCATLTIGSRNGSRGYEKGSTGALSDDEFNYGGADYEVVEMIATPSTMHLSLDQALPEISLPLLTLAVGSGEFALAAATKSTTDLVDENDDLVGTAYTYGWPTIPEVLAEFQILGNEIAVALLAEEAEEGWNGIVPPGLDPEAQYRILFVTDDTRAAGSSDISVYNDFVQDQADAASGDPFDGVTFKALGSTNSVDARCNTQTHTADAHCSGVARVDSVPIYYYKGEKVADDYGDFYDGNWASQDPRDENGEVVGGANPAVFTGSNPSGEAIANHLGNNPNVRVGRPKTAGAELAQSNTARSNQRRIYALSEVLTAPGVAADDYDADDNGLIEITDLAQLNAMRWDLDGDGVAITGNEASYTAAFPNAAAGMGCGWDDPDTTETTTSCRGYELMADLDFDTDGDGATHTNGVGDAGDDYYNAGSGWDPIGDDSVPFDTTFEGNGRTIANLFINRGGESGVGLFGFGGVNSEFRSVGVVNLYVHGNGFVGGLVGKASGTISASYATGSVTGSGGHVGGLVAQNSGSITASYATGSVTGSEIAGGLVGLNYGAITAGYATGSVTGSGTGDSKIGGLVGWASGEVTDSYATGSVSGTVSVGGLIGAVFGTIDVTASYWDTDTSGIADDADTDSPEGRTTTQLQAPTTTSGIYAAWDAAVWDFGDAGRYPALKVDFDGDGTATAAEFGGQGRDLPARVRGVSARATADGAITLNWTAPDDGGSAISGYTVERSEDGGATWAAQSHSGTTASLAQSGLTVGAAYSYRVKAANANGDSAVWSETASATAEATWNGIVPAGLESGETYRILFLTEELPATHDEIDSYNTIVQGEADSADGNPFAGITFKILGSTGSVHARNNTNTNTSVDGAGEPIYYYKGERVADDYADLYDADGWDSQEPRNRNGEIISGTVEVHTGSTRTGAARSGNALSNSNVQQGRATTAGQELRRGNDVVDEDTESRFYALSETLTAPADYDQDDDGLIEVSTLAQLNAMRWDLDGDGVVAAGNEASYTAAFPDAAAGMGCGWDDPDTTETTTSCRGYELMADLDFDTDGDGATHTNGVGDAGDDYYNAGSGWDPIGDDSVPFDTTFEGNGRTIANLFINRGGESDVGLFGGGGVNSEFRNVGVVDVSVTGGFFVAGLTGVNYGRITVTYATGSVSGSGSNSVFVGGLVAQNSGSITASYATGSVSGNGNVGGLVGASFALTDVTDSYAAGSVSTTGNFGGLIGAVAGTADVTASYWDTDTSGIADDADAASPEGRTTTQLQAPTTASGIYAAWDAALWDFGDAGRYPALKYDTDGDGTATAAEFGGQGRDLPARVRGVSAQATADDAITLTWDAPDDGGSAITGYTVERSEDNRATWVEQPHIGTTATLVQSGLSGGQYSYRIKATNANGDSAVWSETASATREVNIEWVPTELAPNAQYRVLFVTAGKRSAGSADIGVYNDFVQGQADAASGDPFDGVSFKALGSTGPVDARCNTQTHADPSDCGGAHTVADVPIYYYRGDRVADDYGDFYDGQWASQEPRDENGELISGNPPVFTGSSSSGVGVSGRKLGGAANINLRIGRPATPGEELDSGTNRQKTSTAALYGLSEVLTAPADQPPVFSPDTVSRSLAENTLAGQNIGAALPAATDANNDALTYTLGGTDAGSFNFDPSSRRLSTKSGVTYDYESRPNYQVEVTADDSNGGTDILTVNIAVTDVAEPPAAPATPAIGTSRQTSLAVNWAAPANTGPAITGYDVQYRAGSSGSFTDAGYNGVGTHHTITGLTAGTSYQVRVRATNAEGTGPWSDSRTGVTPVTTTDNPPVFNPATVPPGLSEGAKYRILFVTEPRNAVPTDIDVYNDFVQSQADGAPGNPFGNVAFKVLGSTDDVDARCNTQTHTQVSQCPGVALVDDVAIYYYKGDKVADDYQDFYDGSWDSSNPRTREGTAAHDRFGVIVFTGTDRKGKKAESHRLGSGGRVAVSRPRHLEPPLGYDDAITYDSTERRRFYALSEVLTATANQAPAFSPATASRSLAENTPAGQNIGAALPAATDADNDTLTYRLGGDDAGSFNFHSSTRQLRAKSGVDYDHETKEEHQVTMTATDRKGGSATLTVTITVTDVAEPPGAPAAPTLGAATSTSLAVNWAAPANTGPAITDYDVQYRAGSSGPFTDAGYDGVGTVHEITGLAAETSYQVQVRAANAEGTGPWSASGTGTTTPPPPTNQAPQITSGPTSLSYPENGAAVAGTYTATDPEIGPDLSWALSGADAGDFSIGGGVLAFRARPDFENPTDADTDNVYQVTVRVSDGALEDTRDVTITVTDVNEPPGAPAAPTLSAATPTSLAVNWVAPANTGPAITDYDVQYREGSSGPFTDASYDGVGTVHEITGLTADTSYQVQVRATNPEGTGPWSATATTAGAPVSISWSPPGLSEGARFRILFITGQRDATSSSIDTYNSFVQSEADGATGNPFAGVTFRVLGSTQTVDARCNTQTHTVDDHCDGARVDDVPIYYYKGEKVADNYGDLYDGDWDSHEPRNRNGILMNGVLEVYTGSIRLGIARGKVNEDGDNDHALGDAEVQVGRPDEQGREMRNRRVTSSRDMTHGFYALSEVLTAR